ncbi:hypothetical protein Tco_1135225 [Tanacetum coccineum]
MESVKKSIDERALHKREYDTRVNERQMQTTEGKVDTCKALDTSLVDTESSGTKSKEKDTSSKSGNDSHADDADIRLIMMKSQWKEIFAYSINKVDSEPANGSDEDITNQYEYEQTLDVSVELRIHDHINEPSSSKLVPKSCSCSRQDNYITTRVGITIPPSHNNAEDSYKDGDGDASFQLVSDSLHYAHAQNYKDITISHQIKEIMISSRIKDKDFHMAPLPPREQRHPFLRGTHRVHVLDFEGMPVLMRDVLYARMRMEHRDGDKVVVFTSQAWARVLLNLDAPGTIQFQLGGAKRRLSWREFILALGLHTGDEMESSGFTRYWSESERMIPRKGDLRDYWRDISTNGDFLGPPHSYTLIRDLVLRLCHRMMAHSIAGRSQAPKKTLRLGTRGSLLCRGECRLVLSKEAPGMAQGGTSGDDKDEEMPQVVPPSPRTQGERIARLEGEVHGMREALQG